MKPFLSLLLVSFFMAAFTDAYGQSDAKAASNDFEVRFTNQSTFDDVVKIRNDARAYGVEISYSKLVFDSNNKLQAIELTARQGEKNVARLSETALSDQVVAKVFNNSKGFGVAAGSTQKE
jgi:hypothetical protein